MLGEVAITSIEVWPLAMAPWVLLPLVTPKARSGWWRVGWSAVAFGLVGGVNAVATGATLVLPALWLVTRRMDKSTLKVAVAWFGCVVAVSFWWLVPLAMLGRYSPPFLDWIENAAVTTSKASVFESFRGTSQWLNFLLAGDGPTWPAGWLYVTQPALILTSAVDSPARPGRPGDGHAEAPRLPAALAGRRPAAADARPRGHGRFAAGSRSCRSCSTDRSQQSATPTSSSWWSGCRSHWPQRTH